MESTWGDLGTRKLWDPGTRGPRDQEAQGPRRSGTQGFGDLEWQRRILPNGLRQGNKMTSEFQPKSVVRHHNAPSPCPSGAMKQAHARKRMTTAISFVIFFSILFDANLLRVNWVSFFLFSYIQFYRMLHSASLYSAQCYGMLFRSTLICALVSSILSNPNLLFDHCNPAQSVFIIQLHY